MCKGVEAWTCRACRGTSQGLRRLTLARTVVVQVLGAWHIPGVAPHAMVIADLSLFRQLSGC